MPDHGPLGGCRVEAGTSAQEIAGIKVAQRQAGVGYGGPLSAPAVAGRARVRAGAVGANVEDASLVHSGDAAPAGTQGVDVDHRRGDLPSRLELLVGYVGDPVFDQRYVGAGAAHVKGYDFALVQQLPDVSRSADATGRAGKDGSHRHVLGVLDGGHTAVGLHDQHVLQLGVGLEPLAQPRQVAAEHRPHVGVDHRGAQAVELLDLGNHLVRQGSVQFRETAANYLRGPLLVGRVQVREQEADG